MKKYSLVIKLEKPTQMKEIFGESVIAEANKNLEQSLQELTAKLLARHTIISQIESEEFGIWSLEFAMDELDPLIDVEEQLESLTKTGIELIHQNLREEFGAATGGRIEFEVLISSVEDDKGCQLKEAERISDSDLLYKDLITKQEFKEIIESKQLNTYFQPLLSLADKKVIGYEALTRGPMDSELFSAANLFGAAAYFDLTEQLELASIAQALEWAEQFGDRYKIALNVGPELLKADKFYQFISQEKFKPILPAVILEITEHLPVEKVKQLQERVEQLKELGIEFALDDLGCGFFDLETVKRLEPAIVKLCITVINKIDQSQDVQQSIYQTVERIKKLGAQILGEGVEREEQVEALQEGGFELAQGYYFAKPQPAEEIVNEL
ncbi:EAL domain-containing protein [Natroniella sulfidigena]|uniref:EAL domain-containing protein n=1 Tax=Natroniella sulfidigena TaxID=723921 RepID=UPI00200A1BD0|nr:EAL domain-containing protein [Natroniella sulfidigena]MCK8818010.1 EAL domain-containing protein [Natroniella sulfidigena]